VLQPGRPGEQARVVDQPEKVVPEDTWSHSDIAFMQMMIPHHGQALTMSRLAGTRAEDARVRTLAERIEAAQGPEIMMMAAWLEERGVDVPQADDDPAAFDHSAHGHNAMAGMLTAEEMDRLRTSGGREFDRLFLRGMIGHHRGALTMVDDWAPEGADVRVSELAADVAATQAAEILRMQDLLRSL
jgi:uncharacterized protein (DUF305 family)